MEFSSVLLVFFLFLMVVTYETKGYEALIGELCEMDRNCLTKQMVCNPDKTCDCMKGHYPSDDRRGCIATTSALCFENSDCVSLPSSSCVILDQFEGTCTCNDGYLSSEDERQCLPEASYRGSCTQVAQCTLRLGSYATCKEGSCDCQVNHHYSEPDGQCIADVGLLGACVDTKQCVSSDPQNNPLVCRSGRCSCPDGYEEFQDVCRAGAQNVPLSGAVLLVYWIIKLVVRPT